MRDVDVVELANRLTVLASDEGITADVLVSACCLVLADLMMQAHAQSGKPTTELLAVIIKSVLDNCELLRDVSADELTH